MGGLEGWAVLRNIASGSVGGWVGGEVFYLLMLLNPRPSFNQLKC